MSALSEQTLPARTRPLRLLIVADSTDLPHPVRHLIRTRPLELVRVDSLRQAREPDILAQVDAVLLCHAAERDEHVAAHELQLLNDAMLSHRLTGVALPDGAGVAPEGDGAFTLVDADVSADELWGRIVTIRQYRPLLQQMEGQMVVMQRLGKRLNQQFTEVDQELRLASRLQRDFLPKVFPEVGDVRFAALFRPATWVSGDVYDVRRLDEKSISFYVADAVGHGVAAGLLTMFIRQAMNGKRVTRTGYQLIPPDEVLATLNDHLAEQELPNCQFVTACYGRVDATTGEVVLARGGHPHPIHVRADGECTEVRTIGGLLGIMPSESFPSVHLQLEPGDKLVIYSDGLEDQIIARRQRDDDSVQFTSEFLELIREPAARSIERLGEILDQSEGSLSPADDQTCVIVERLPS